MKIKSSQSKEDRRAAVSLRSSPRLTRIATHTTSSERVLGSWRGSYVHARPSGGQTAQPRGYPLHSPASTNGRATRWAELACDWSRGGRGLEDTPTQCALSLLFRREKEESARATPRASGGVFGGACDTGLQTARYKEKRVCLRDVELLSTSLSLSLASLFSLALFVQGASAT